MPHILPLCTVYSVSLASISLLYILPLYSVQCQPRQHLSLPQILPLCTVYSISLNSIFLNPIYCLCTVHVSLGSILTDRGYLKGQCHEKSMVFYYTRCCFKTSSRPLFIGLKQPPSYDKTPYFSRVTLLFKLYPQSVSLRISLFLCLQYNKVSSVCQS